MLDGSQPAAEHARLVVVSFWFVKSSRHWMANPRKLQTLYQQTRFCTWSMGCRHVWARLVQARLAANVFEECHLLPWFRRKGHHSRAAVNGLLLFGETWICWRSEDVLVAFFYGKHAPDMGDSLGNREDSEIQPVLSIPENFQYGTASQRGFLFTPQSRLNLSNIFLASRKHGNCMMFRVDDDDSAPGTQQRWQDCNYTGESDSAAQRYRLASPWCRGS